MITSFLNVNSLKLFLQKSWGFADIGKVAGILRHLDLMLRSFQNICAKKIILRIKIKYIKAILKSRKTISESKIEFSTKSSFLSTFKPCLQSLLQNYFCKIKFVNSIYYKIWPFKLNKFLYIYNDIIVQKKITLNKYFKYLQMNTFKFIIFNAF